MGKTAIKAKLQLLQNRLTPELRFMRPQVALHVTAARRGQLVRYDFRVRFAGLNKYLENTYSRRATRLLLNSYLYRGAAADYTSVRAGLKMAYLHSPIKHMAYSYMCQWMDDLIEDLESTYERYLFTTD